MKTIKKILNRLRGEPNLKKLKKRGLKIGKNFKMMGGCIIDPSHCWHITIGNNVTLAPRVHIIAHDASTKAHLNYTRISNVILGNNVFVGAGSIILPGVVIGNDVIIGAGSVVSKNIPDNTVFAGNPAKKIFSKDEYLRKVKMKMKQSNCFDDSFTLRNKKFGKYHLDTILLASNENNEIFIK